MPPPAGWEKPERRRRGRQKQLNYCCSVGCLLKSPGFIYNSCFIRLSRGFHSVGWKWMWLLLTSNPKFPSLHLSEQTEKDFAGSSAKLKTYETNLIWYDTRHEVTELVVGIWLDFSSKCLRYNKIWNSLADLMMLPGLTVWPLLQWWLWPESCLSQVKTLFLISTITYCSRDLTLNQDMNLF